jgi:hypothetical protein
MADNQKNLTEEERLLILKHLEFYQSLETGERSPTTEDQKHFVDVCQGHAKPKTEHEIAYAKFKRIYDTKKDSKILKNIELDWAIKRKIAYLYNKKRVPEKAKKSHKRYMETKPKRLTKEQLRLIKSKHDYRPRTPLEIQEFRNRAIRDKEYIAEKDYERRLRFRSFGFSRKGVIKKGWWQQLQDDDYPETQTDYGQDLEALHGIRGKSSDADNGYKEIKLQEKCPQCGKLYWIDKGCENCKAIKK